MLTENGQRVFWNSHRSDLTDGLVIFCSTVLSLFFKIFNRKEVNLCVLGPKDIGYLQVMDLQITNHWDIFRVQHVFRSSLTGHLKSNCCFFDTNYKTSARLEIALPPCSVLAELLPWRTHHSWAPLWTLGTSPSSLQILLNQPCSDTRKSTVDLSTTALCELLPQSSNKLMLGWNFSC